MEETNGHISFGDQYRRDAVATHIAKAGSELGYRRTTIRLQKPPAGEKEIASFIRNYPHHVTIADERERAGYRFLVRDDVEAIRFNNGFTSWRVLGKPDTPAVPSTDRKLKAIIDLAWDKLKHDPKARRE